MQALDLDGAALWAMQLGTSNTDQVLAIAVAPSGTLYIGGTTAGALPGFTATGTFDNFLITIVP